jgi:hypothetical protein
MPADRAALVSVIVAALQERRPVVSLATARVNAETILRRLKEAGWTMTELGRDRIVMLPDGQLQCMICENLWPLVDSVPADYLSDQAKRDLG